MPLLQIELPPGIYRNGTEYQSKDRYRDGTLVRFFEGSIRPVGGWRTHSLTTVSGVGRCIVTWRANDSTPWCAVGTEKKLYSMAQDGTLYDITPSGFTAGIADAVAGGGYGIGNYGDARNYGNPGLDTTQIQDATVASLDTFGQYLVFCTADDGKIYEWQLNTAAPAAAVSGAPTARALVMTDKLFLLALGAAGVPRRVQWADEGSITTWTPASTNQAGSQDLQTAGKLMMGKRVAGGTLLWTDLDVWLGTYTGDNFVHRFDKKGEGCGACSQNCAASFDGNAVWMGKASFWLYNGYVLPLPCEVQDYVFSDINAQQISKVTCHVDSVYGEVTWHYPSSASTENDRYVTWSYRAWERGQNVWSIGGLARLSGCDRGAFGYPLRVGSDGYVYDHEVGFTYQDHGASALTPYLESGPIEIGNGDNVAYAVQLIPDEANQGDVTAAFKAKFYPNGPETSYGPYTMSAPTDVRFPGRQFKVRYTAAANDDWRIGNFRLDIRMGGKR